MVIGKVLTITELFERGYESVFIASGAGLPMFMKIPGESLVGVYSANEYLTRINLMKAYKPEAETPILHNKKVAVVGGGNVAMDAARCAKRLGAEVHIIYRRSEAELPARAEEVHHAKEEGIIFDLLTNPIAIEGDEQNHVKAITCIRMELGEPDESGRRRPVPVKGSEFETEVDAVIMALGTQANQMSYDGTPGLEKTRKGCVAADEKGCTSCPGIFAGGTRPPARPPLSWPWARASTPPSPLTSTSSRRADPSDKPKNSAAAWSVPCGGAFSKNKVKG